MNDEEKRAERARLRVARLDALQAIDDERDRQDKQWGGPEHDDAHKPVEWCEFIAHQNATGGCESLGLFEDCHDATDEEKAAAFRSRMVKVAALALAAIESHDRKAAARGGA